MKRNCFLPLIFTLTFFACNPLVQNLNTDSDNESVVRLENGLYKIPLKINISADNSKAIAAPDYSELKNSILYFNITAVNASNSSDTKGPFKIEKAPGGDSFSGNIELPYGSWIISADGFDLSNKKLFQTAVGTSETYDPSNGRPLSISVYPIISSPTGSSYTGTVSLKVNFPKIEDGKPQNYYTKADIDGIVSTNSDMPVTLNSDSVTEVTYDFSNVPVGNHNMTIMVWTEDEPSKIKSIFESVIVNANATSKVWWNGNAQESITFTHEQLQYIDYSQYAFYVHGTDGEVFTSKDVAADKMQKTNAIKCGSIQDAVNIIEAIDPTGTKEWEIGIDGTLTCTKSNSSSANAFIRIGKSSTPNIHIKGYGSNKPVINLDTKDRAVYLNNSKKFSLENVKIIKGKDFKYINGGACYLIKCTDNVTIKDCVFEDNTSKNGGALFISEGIKNINIVNCVFKNNKCASDISNSINVTTAYNFNGGAICIQAKQEADNNISISGCTFEGNSSAQFGNAVYISQGKGITLSDCRFTDNLCTGDVNGVKPSLSACVYLSNCNVIFNGCRFSNPVATCSIYSNSNVFTELSEENVVDKWYIYSLPNTNGTPNTLIKINSDFDKDRTRIKFDFNDYDKAISRYLMTPNEGCGISISDIISCLDIVDMGYEWKDLEISDKHYVKIQKVGSSNINPDITFDNGHVVEYCIVDDLPISLASFSQKQICLKVIIDNSINIITEDNGTEPTSVKLYYASEIQEDSNAEIECSGSVYSGQYIITIYGDLYPDNYYFIIESEYEGVKSKQRIDFKITE